MIGFLVEVRRPKPRVAFQRFREARWKGPVAEIGAADRSASVGGRSEISATVTRFVWERVER
jgi:hypothetical protein